MQTYKRPQDANYKILNSNAVAMADAQPYGLEIDDVRNLISGLAAWFFLIILKFILTLIFEIKIYERKFINIKKIREFDPYMRQSLSCPKRVWL